MRIGSSGSSANAAGSPIICLHGFGQKGDSWDAVAALLEERGRSVVAPDLPSLMGGAGDPQAPFGSAGLCRPSGPFDSHRPPDPLDAVCDGVAALIRGVCRQTGRRPILVGYSMGGRIALETVARARSASADDSDLLPIAGIVLESAGLGPSDACERERLRCRNREWAARVRNEGVAAFMDWWESLPLFASQREQPADVRASLREGRLSNDAATLSLELEGWGQHAQTGKADALSCLNRLAARDVAIAYFAGALDRKYCTVAEQVRAAVPAAVVCIFSDAGHNVHLEAPEKFVRAVEDVADWCEIPLRQTASACE